MGYEIVATNHPIVPMEQICLPASLDGSAGDNRFPGKCQISAKTDLDAIRAWLATFVDSPATLANYRKEAERLYLWATQQIGKPVSSLTHEDFLVYKHFLEDPQPRERWVSAGGKKYQRGHELWRLFYGPLSAASRRQALVIINVMLSWMVEAKYLQANPLSLVRNKTRKKKPQTQRVFDHVLWDELRQYIAALPRFTDKEIAYYARAKWLVSIFYLSALRISEVANAGMGNFNCSRTREEGKIVERWWLWVVGKGDKEANVPVSDELIQELKAYRVANTLSPLPAVGEDLPLVLPLRSGKNGVRNMHRTSIHNALKDIFKGAARWIERVDPENPQRAEILRKASAHWLRHTAGTHMLEAGIPLAVVRDSLRHESIATTNTYLHTEDNTRHKEVTQKHRIEWNK